MVTPVLNNLNAVAGQCVDAKGSVFFRGNKAGTFAVAKGRYSSKRHFDNSRLV